MTVVLLWIVRTMLPVQGLLAILVGLSLSALVDWVFRHFGLPNREGGPAL